MADRIDISKLEGVLQSLDDALLSDNGVVVRRSELKAILAELRQHREREQSAWIEGAPVEAGSYWVVMWLMNPDRWEVRLVDISPAVLNPGGRLLLKMIGGAAFEYEANRYAISHHLPVGAPASPVDSNRPPPPEAKP